MSHPAMALAAWRQLVSDSVDEVAEYLFHVYIFFSLFGLSDFLGVIPPETKRNPLPRAFAQQVLVLSSLRDMCHVWYGKVAHENRLCLR